ncbi:putative disease resistance RPP13-like protein 2 [Salvia hispanica]|uniref:putative disease resistance RPP13-like protein 2 n=1 Tax=Salvia hispanica TaxID=49212 RepID=UPI002009633D|nr:putative disease resistance RPP13-like protein 2 [Salvia hispanica]
MAAYGAAVSLKNTITRIVHSSRINLVGPSREIIKPAYIHMCLLQKTLQKLEGTGYNKIRTKVNALDERIKEVVWKFEDLLETCFTDQILAQLESEGDHLSFSVDLQSLRESVDCLVEELMEMLKDYYIQVVTMPEEEGEPICSRIDFSGINSEMVGLSDVFKKIRGYLLADSELESEGEGESEGEVESEGESESECESEGESESESESEIGDENEGESEGESEDEGESESEGESEDEGESESESEIGDENEGESESESEEDEWHWLLDVDQDENEEKNEYQWNRFFDEDLHIVNWLLVTGMAGVGKTTLAKKIFDDQLIQRHFELRAWIKVGRKCEFNEILRCILAQVDPDTHDQMLTQGEDADNQKLAELFEERVKDKKCLIVLDDVWETDTQLMDILIQENVRILVTSRLRIKESPFYVKVRFLTFKESMKLFGKKVFGEKGIPPHLEELGKIIVYKCEGLPLMIVTVAEFLSKEDKTPEYWTEVAGTQHNSVFVGACDQISEVFFPSYEYLPQYLKMLFLYVGAFPPYENIDLLSATYLVISDGFFEPSVKHTSKGYLNKCLKKLSRHYHLIQFERGTKSWFSENKFYVHSCWMHLCKKEASKIKFLHVLQSCDEVMEDQRRLCAHGNMLFAFKQVYDSIKSDCSSTARSLLCHGPYNQYPVPIHAMDFKLLRVLHANAVRFYYFPLEIVKLVCLRRGAPSYMPVEIWNMQALQNIRVYGKDLPTPNCDATLDKLHYLTGVTAKSCTREVLKRIPNLILLLIQMELKPYDDDDGNNPFSGSDYTLEDLHNLENLAYMVRNPDIKYEHRVPLSMFPSSLTKLSLYGLGCPWKYMNDIGLLLPNLNSLHLECYAFRGAEWDVELRGFLKLRTLVIEDTDLVRWRAQHGSLPCLDLLSIRHCYKLQQLDWQRDPSIIRATIELVECSPVVVASALKLPYSLFRVRGYSTF